MPADELRHTLLIVDDEPGLLQSLRHQSFRDYRVPAAENGRDALDLLGCGDLHAIHSDHLISDLNLANERLNRANRVLTESNGLRRALPDSARLGADFDELSRRVSGLEGEAARAVSEVGGGG
jgi:hypothetical protein